MKPSSLRSRPNHSFVSGMSERMRELLQQRSALSRDDLEYLVVAVGKLKDQRLKECVTELIGWGDDERAEVETFVAIAIEVMKTVNTSKLRAAAQTVELRYLVKEIEP
jgi:hypothetical protein